MADTNMHVECPNCHTLMSAEYSSCLSCGLARTAAPVPNAVYAPPQSNQIALFVPSITRCFMRYAQFSGRAPAYEFWWFLLFQTLLSLFVTLLFGRSATAQNLHALLTVVLFVPGLAVAVRRLHDVGKSGWNLLWEFTIIGILYILFLDVQRSQPVANKWGEPDPIVLSV